MEDFIGGVVGKDLDEEGDDAFDDDGIAFAGKMNEAVAIVGLQPDPALAALDEVLRSLVLFIERLLAVAEFDEHLVFVHPVVDATEVVDNLVLYFVYGHWKRYFMSVGDC